MSLKSRDHWSSLSLIIRELQTQPPEQLCHCVVVRYTYMLQTLFIFHSHLAQLGLIAQFLYTAVITPDTYNHLLQLYTISRPSNYEQVTPGVDNANA